MNHEKGVSLIELMIAMVLAALLGVVLLNTLYATLSDDNLQHALAAMQQSEQHISQNMQDIAREAGYFSIADASTTDTSALQADTVFPAHTGTYGSFAAGQVVDGTDSLLDVRFQSVASTNTNLSAPIDCSGQSSTRPVLDDNAYFVSGSNLDCAVNGGTPQVIISGVQKMGIIYGVSTTSSGSVNSYETAQEVSANNAWSEVLSAQVTVYLLLNPTASSVPFTFNLDFKG